ncbi:substrate-binding periplasmic protein [Metapseudomonas boanensis]
MNLHFRVNILLLLSLWSHLAVAEELHWGFGPAEGMPYVQVSDHALLGGFIRRLGEQVAETLGVTVSFVETPNKRIEESLKNGRIHVICNTNPEWLADAPAFHWSPPLFEETHALLQHRDSAPVTSLTDLKGKTVGTTLGFTYSMPLMEAFANKQVIRQDIRDLDTRLNLLSRKRLDAIIEMRRSLTFELAVRPGLPLVSSPWVIDRYSMHCAYGPRLPVTAEQLDATLQSLRDSGEIERLLDGEQFRARLQDH